MREIDKLNEIAKRRTLKTIINDIYEVTSNYKNDDNIIKLEILFRGLRSDFPMPIEGNEGKKYLLKNIGLRLKFYTKSLGLVEIMNTEVED